MPAWADHCRNCLGENFARRFHLDYDNEWDAYRIGEVIQRHLHAFAPASVKATDALSEMYRSRVHHIGYLRNALAHPSAGQPSSTECLAGSLAVLEVLQAHGIRVDEAGLTLPLLKRIADAERTAEPADLLSAACVELNVDLSAEQLRQAVLESALQHAATTLGSAICERWDAARVRPEWVRMPMDLAGSPPTGGKSIALNLVGHGGNLKAKWAAVGKNKTRLVPALGKVGTLVKARNDREHGQLDSFDWVRIELLIDELIGVFTLVD